MDQKEALIEAINLAQDCIDKLEKRYPMKYNPSKQTTFGTKGNCLAAVIATLFDIDITDVPIFGNGDNEENWISELSEWTAQKFGKYIAPMKLTNPEDTFIFCDSLIITTINSPTPGIERHAVITKGNRIIFDPIVGEADLKLSNDLAPTFMVIGDVIKKEKL